MRRLRPCNGSQINYESPKGADDSNLCDWMHGSGFNHLSLHVVEGSLDTHRL